MSREPSCGFLFFFFNDTPTTEIYTLSLHDALPIFARLAVALFVQQSVLLQLGLARIDDEDRKSTRLNSSHTVISYAVFCLKKKKQNNTSVQCDDKEASNN